MLGSLDLSLSFWRDIYMLT